MKSIQSLLLIIGVVFTSLMATAQSGFILNSLTTLTPTVQSCDQNVTISIGALSNTSTSSDFNLILNGSNFSPSQFSLIINWGDGSTTTHFGTATISGTPINWTPSLYHYYNAPGPYTISLQLTNSQNNTNVSSNLYYLQNSCSWVSAYVQLDCNNDGIIDNTNLSNVPVTITGPNGYNSQMNTSNGGVWTQVTTAGNYTATIDPNWLTANNYVLSSSSSSQLSVSLPNDSDTANLILNCANTGGANLCISGTAYCDANNNSLFDAGETVFANVPLTISNNGITYLVYTNANGFYTLNYSGTVGSPTVVMVNGIWMSQNNCTTQSFATTVLASNCGTTNTLNVPFICTTCTTPSVCASVLVFCDANGNGNIDTNESPLINAPVSIYSTGNNNPVTIYTDSSGYASICGNYFTSNLTYAQINQQWFQQNGYTGNTTTPVQLYLSNNPIPNTALIPINCSSSNNSCDDLWTTVTPWIGYYQGTTAMIKLNYGNYGPGTATTYTVSFSYPLGVAPVLSSINLPGYTISGNTITWNLTNAAPGYSYTDIIYFTIPSGLLNGAQHYYTSNISATGANTDCNYANNDGSLLQILGNSYDPNDKTVHQAEQMSPVITDNLTYTIRFQNTGTAPAQNIHIIDTLSNNLDWSTFDMIYASHNMQVVDLGNGIRRFEFPQIWLPDSTTNEPLSHGMLVYRIKELVTNGEGEEIFNTAHIYFDWNPAIVTNTTYNVNSSLGLNELENSSLIYPNPASTHVTVTIEEQIEHIRIYDLMGKEWMSSTPQNSQAALDVSSLPSGIYMVNVTSESGTFTERLIKN